MPTRAIILGDPQGDYTRRLLSAAPRHWQVSLAPFTDLATQLSWPRPLPGPRSVAGAGLHSPPEQIEVAGGPLQPGDVAIVRSMSRGTLESIVFRMDVLATLEQQGVLVYNPAKSLELAIDKYLTLSRLAAAGFSVPATHVSQTVDQALVGFKQLGGDVVVKPLFGSEGRGLIRVSDHDHAARVFHSLAVLDSVIYQQQFIPHGGKDIRVLVIGQKRWAIERQQTQDWRTNLARGGHAQPIALSGDRQQLAVQACRSLGLLCAGVDLVHDPTTGQDYVLEVNGIPGWNGVAQAHNADIAAEIWAHVAAIVAQREQDGLISPGASESNVSIEAKMP